MLAALVCAAVAASAVAGQELVCKQPPSCPVGWIQHCDRCFLYVPQKLSWVDAQTNCQSMDATLTPVHSELQYTSLQDAIRQITKEDMVIWIGGSDAQQEGEWLWILGEPFVYSKWCTNEPDGGQTQNCIQINVGDEKCWADVECTDQRPSFCVKDLLF